MFSLTQAREKTVDNLMREIIFLRDIIDICSRSRQNGQDLRGIVERSRLRYPD